VRLTAANGTAVGLLVAAATGCGGSSSKPPPPGGPAGGGWEVFGQGRHNRGATIAGADGIASNPQRLQLRINSSPNVSTRARYQVTCGQGAARGTHTGRTPFTQELRIPSSGGSQESHGLFCSVSVRASKPAKAEMIVTLLERPEPGP
jgi:hypothetical protein